LQGFDVVPVFSVALCADKNIVVGLHVTMYSLLESARAPIRIYLVQHGYNSRDIAILDKTLRAFSDKYELNVVSFNDRSFHKYRGLQGNRFTFVKLAIADIIQEERILYLDSDLVISKDVTSLANEDLNQHVIAVPGVGTIKYSLENQFFTSLGLKPDAAYF